MTRTVLFDAAKSAACFAFTTRDRVDVTLQALPPLAFEPGFDLIWVDGSATDEGRALPHRLAPDMAQLREIESDVVGGPDAAIVTALTRMLALGYDYCGLIENDIALEAGWFAAMMALFDAGTADGLAVGAVTARAFESRILLKRPGYAVPMNTGAGMVLFTRAAARLVLDHYRTPSTAELRTWFLYASGRDCASFGEPAFRQGPGSDIALASDYQYDLVLQRHGLCALATVPVRARDVPGGGVNAAGLGGYAAPAAGPDPAADAAFEILRTRLAAQRRQAAPWAPPFLWNPMLKGWVVFVHQLLFMPGSPVRLRGRWRLRWSKMHGPFLLETDDPDATLECPLAGVLRGVGLELGPGGAALEIHDGIKAVAVMEGAGAAPLPLYAPLDIAPVGTVPLRLRRASAGTLRLFGLCFAEPPPWLPRSAALDAERLAAALAVGGAVS